MDIGKKLKELRIQNDLTLGDLASRSELTKGFLSQVKNSLTAVEKRTLNLGVLAMTAELAARFLTDYLNGDKYFKTKYPGHNLDRTRNQIALSLDVMSKMDLMDEIIEKYL